jgi:hypothetical protein
LNQIKAGYAEDEFIQKIAASPLSTPGAHQHLSLWYIRDCLLIPQVGDVHKTLYGLVHDSAGYFGADKSYTMLWDTYYWPNMRKDLEKSYIPLCVKCQQNKLQTTKSSGPLHPLPIPDKRGDSVALDFIRPLLLDKGFDCILSIMDRLNSNI